MSAQVFDAAAASYDATFTATRLGRWLRELVWERLAPRFKAGDRVLELGCGTGEDAVWLARRGALVAATDGSPGMLAAAAEKARLAGVGDRVALAQLDLAAPRLALPVPPGGFDGAISNFGALNCVADRRPAAELLAACLRPGGAVALVLMGPLCLWEVGYHVARLRPRDAARRLLPAATAHVGGGAGARVWYPSPARLRREMGPAFRHVETLAVGSLLPPSYLDRAVERRPELFQALALLERRAARGPWPWLSDHYMAVFERV